MPGQIDRDLAKLEPEFRFRLELAISRYGRLYPGDNQPFVTEGYRTQERQNTLYAQGRTTPGQVVTQTLKSRHTEGLAADIAFTKSLYSDAVPFARFAAIAHGVGLESGYNWPNFQDMPHVQKPKIGYGRILPLDISGLGIDRVYLDGQEIEVNLINKVGSKLFITGLER